MSAMASWKVLLRAKESLLAFDNYDWTALVEPGIDVIEQPVNKMGLAAVETLFGGIASAADKSAGAVVKQRFAGKLIKRGSCAPPGKTPK